MEGQPKPKNCNYQIGGFKIDPFANFVKSIVLVIKLYMYVLLHVCVIINYLYTWNFAIYCSYKLSYK